MIRLFMATLIRFVLVVSLMIIIQATTVAQVNVLKDKEGLKNCITNTIEYFRDTSHFDNKNFYAPYIKTNYSDIIIDELIYNKDSLLAFCFFAIEDEINNQKQYDAQAILCLRKNKKDYFQIFPIDLFIMVGFPSSLEALSALKHVYKTELKDKEDRLKQSFKANVGDSDFWENSLYLKIIEDLYYFQFEIVTHQKEDFRYELIYRKLDYPQCK